MLGLIHKRVLGLAPQPFETLLPYSDRAPGYATRLSMRRRSKQLLEPRLTTDMQNNSSLGLIRVYNLLPGHTVDAGSVHVFFSERTNDRRQDSPTGWTSCTAHGVFPQTQLYWRPLSPTTSHPLAPLPWSVSVVPLFLLFCLLWWFSQRSRSAVA